MEASKSITSTEITNNQEVEHIISSIIEVQRQALEQRSVELWMEVVYSEDSIADQIQRLWFEGYLCHIAPSKVIFEMSGWQVREQHIDVTLLLAFEYAEYDRVEERHVYTIAFVPALQSWRVTWMTKLPPAFPLALFTPRNLKLPEAWPREKEAVYEQAWPSIDCLALTREASDPLPNASYLKAIPRTVRFREEHPELECATILANMMSLLTAQVTSQLAATDLRQFLANLYAFGQEHISVQMSRADRDNTWGSKLNAPWFCFDEIVAQREGQGPFIGSCPSVMSFYLAVLRLGGFAPLDVVQLRLHNQDVLLLEAENATFLLCPDKVVKLTSKTLYYTNRVNKLFSDIWYWTRFGATNLPSAQQSLFRRLLAPTIPTFRFDPAPSRETTTLMPLETAPLFSVPRAEPMELHLAAKKQILGLSNQLPSSPFTWAKYAYQTLYVRKPEVYAAWSLKSPHVIEGLSCYKTHQDLFQFLRTLGKCSIFLEDDRLMTADQVLRYRTGDYRARTLLLFTYCRLQREEAYLLFTRKHAYCVRRVPGGWQRWEDANEESVVRREDAPVLAFNENESYYPALRAGDTIPAWYRAIVLTS